MLIIIDCVAQIAELKRGAEIIVCTPGRMIDMLTANNGQYYYLFASLFIVYYLFKTKAHIQSMHVISTTLIEIRITIDMNMIC